MPGAIRRGAGACRLRTAEVLALAAEGALVDAAVVEARVTGKKVDVDVEEASEAAATASSRDDGVVTYSFDDATTKDEK